MARCEHEDAPAQQWEWLPRAENHATTRHAWCTRCGTVKYAGPRRARDIGGLANRLTSLYRVLEQNGVRVTTVQKRLIAKRLLELGLDDAYGLARGRQDEALAQVVAERVSASPEAVARFLRV